MPYSRGDQQRRPRETCALGCLGERNQGTARRDHLPATCGHGVWAAALPGAGSAGCPRTYGSAAPPAPATAGLRAGTAVLRDSQTSRDAPSSPGRSWCPTAEHGPCRTLCDSLPSQSRRLGVPWRHCPWGNLIPDFSSSGAFSSLIPAKRARLAITVRKKKEIMALRARGPPCLCWSPAPSRRAACGLQGDGVQGELLAYFFDLVLNPCVA